MKQLFSILAVVMLMAQVAFAQEFALSALEASPRHHEWVEVKQGERSIHCFVAYPEKAGNAQAVVVIHENRGLTDWVRSFADQLAAAGYLAIAPDLLSDFDENIKKTGDFATSDDARNGIYALNPDQVTKDLEAVTAYIAQVPSSSGDVSVAGFCWGGSQSFRFATNSGAIKKALVFYGTAPAEAAALARIQVPVYGFYGENDQRVNATIAPTAELMEQHGKTYIYEIYQGAGHAYMRRGDDPEEAGSDNEKAKDASWERILKVLSE